MVYRRRAFRKSRKSYGRLRRRFKRSRRFRASGRGYGAYKRVVRTKGYGARGDILRRVSDGALKWSGRLGAGSAIMYGFHKLASSYTNKELKRIEFGLDDQPISTSGNYANITYHWLAAISQGTGRTQRIGRSIRVLRIQLRAFVSNNYAYTGQTGAIDGQLVRIKILCDQRPNGALPTANEYYVNDEDRLSRRHWGTDAGITDRVISRFGVLKQTSFMLDAHTDDRTRPFDKTIYWDIPTSIVVKYDTDNTDAAVIGDVAWNNLVLSYQTFRSDGQMYNTGVLDAPEITWSAVISYIDD